MKKALGFVLRLAVVSLVWWLGTNFVPVIRAMAKYCVEQDNGLVWVINMAAAVAAFAVVRVLRIGGKANVVFGVICALLALVVSEAAWHHEAVAAMLRQSANAFGWREILATAIIAIVAYCWQLFDTRRGGRYD